MSSINLLGLSTEDQIRLYAWARYVYWAEVEYQQYAAHTAPDDEPVLGQTIPLLVQWYAAIWVAVEGWQQCRELLPDPVVEELLTDPVFEPNCTLLRRCRNGVYHYQSDILNHKLLGFISKTDMTFTWAFLVHDEFSRLAFEIAHPSGMPAALQSEFAEAARELIGWLPSDTVQSHQRDATTRYLEVAEMILRDGSRNSPHAIELLKAVEELKEKADAAVVGWTSTKRKMIRCLKEGRRMLSEQLPGPG
ncbi:MAG TPA: hypothetical protein VJ865_03505 [Gemmatimonadaceae bacterium]|nr:hypothetical protein [Gemmatimonadaceae bacterium]